MEMPAEAREAIRRYLNAVATAMTAAPEDEQRDILNELEAHIRDALASRLHGAEPTAADVGAVLADMDPPESYADTSDESATPNRESASRPEVGRKTVGLTALIVVMAGLLLTIFVFACQTLLIQWGVDPEGIARGAMVVCALGCLLGWLSFRTPSGKIAAWLGSALLLFFLTMLMWTSTPSQRGPDWRPSDAPAEAISP